MKKLNLAILVVALIVGLASFALAVDWASPGWSNGRGYENYGRYDRSGHQYDQRSYRHYRELYRKPVILRNARVMPPPVVRVYEPARPCFRLSLPNFRMEIR